MGPLPDDLPISHVLPPITRIPMSDAALAQFVATGTRPWGGEAVEMPDAVTAWFWAVLAANTGFGAWLAAVVFGHAQCSGLSCAVATWDRPGFLLVLAAVCVVTITTVSVLSHGLTNIAPVPLSIAVTGAACGVVAVAGIAALLALVVTGLAIAGGVLVAVIDRI